MQEMQLVPAGQDKIPLVPSGMGPSGKTFSGILRWRNLTTETLN